MRIGDIIELSEYGKRKIALLPTFDISDGGVGKVIGIVDAKRIQVTFTNRDGVATTLPKRFIRLRPRRGGRKNG